MPKATEPDSLHAHKHRREVGDDKSEDPDFTGDLRRFENNGFIYRILHTTIQRDDLRFHRGWEIYNDQGKIVDWFYDTDAGGKDPKDYAANLIQKKFKSGGLESEPNE